MHVIAVQSVVCRYLHVYVCLMSSFPPLPGRWSTANGKKFSSSFEEVEPPLPAGWVVVTPWSCTTSVSSDVSHEVSSRVFRECSRTRDTCHKIFTIHFIAFYYRQYTYVSLPPVCVLCMMWRLLLQGGSGGWQYSLDFTSPTWRDEQGLGSTYCRSRCCCGRS